MTSTVVESILKERELINEKKISVIRFLIITVGFILDFFSYFQIIAVTLITPTKLTLFIDSLYFIFSLIILISVVRKIYPKYLKFIIISIDYFFVANLHIFDPTILKEVQVIFYSTFVAVVFLFFLNLLRFSKEGTIYAGILSILTFIGIILYFNVQHETDMFTMLFALLIFILIGYSITTSNKNMMIEANTKKMMERYLPPQLVGELYKNNVNLEPGGKIQEVTILFSDIRSFSSVSEAMSAGEVVTFLNQYLSTMTEIIFVQKGTIDKFIGDAIMTIFGAPIQGNDDALRAVNTAMLMIKSLREFNKSSIKLKEPLEIGIGIHTGEVIAGNIGSDKRLDYTVIGDNVNLASRIEGLTKYYKCPILISGSTRLAILKGDIQTSLCMREVDKVIVKGKSEPVTIYEVMCFDDDEQKHGRESLKAKFESGLQLYRERNFVEALVEFNNIQKDELSKLYTERCKKFIENPPAVSWDGTYAMETK